MEVTIKFNTENGVDAKLLAPVLVAIDQVYQLGNVSIPEGTVAKMDPVEMPNANPADKPKKEKKESEPKTDKKDKEEKKTNGVEITDEQLTAAMSSYAKANDRKKAIAIAKKYGKALGDIPQEKRAAMIAELAVEV